MTAVSLNAHRQLYLACRYVTSFMGLGCEGIVPRYYDIWLTGMRKWVEATILLNSIAC